MSAAGVRSEDAWILTAGAALCAGGRWLASLSLVLTACAGWALAAGADCLAAGIALLLGLAAAYLALRVEIDAHLFAALARACDQAGGAPAVFDAALQRLGWLNSQRAGRALSLRVAGSQRLVNALAMVSAAQALLLVFAAWLD